MRIVQLFLLFMLLLGLGGCGPVYELRDEYRPPAGASGKQCILDCEDRRSDCGSDCNRAYRRCVRHANEEAKDAYTQALEVYTAEMDAYRAEKTLYDREYHHYRHEKSKLDDAYDHAKKRCKQNDPRACAHKKRVDDQLDRLRQDYYGYEGPLHEEPEEPDKPSLEEETDRILALRCDQTCSCQADFKSCYIGCGGRVETHRYCVENCD